MSNGHTVEKNYVDRSGKKYAYRCTTCYQRRQSPFTKQCRGDPFKKMGGVKTTSRQQVKTESGVISKDFSSPHIQTLLETDQFITKREKRKRSGRNVDAYKSNNRSSDSGYESSSTKKKKIQSRFPLPPPPGTRGPRRGD